MPFDPDEYLKNKRTKKPFNPDVYLAQKRAESPKEDSFFQEFVKAPLSEIGSDISTGARETVKSFTDPTLSLPENLLQGTGSFAKGLVDIPTNMVARGLRDTGILQGATNINRGIFGALPESIQKKAKTTVETIGKGVGDFAERHPRALGNLGAIANIAEFIPVNRALGQVFRSGKKGIRRGVNTLSDLKTPFTTAERATAISLKQKVRQGKLSTGRNITEDFIPSQAPSESLRETFISRKISPQDRSILSEPLNPKDTPFTDYQVMAKQAIENPRNLTPMDIAGKKAKTAFDDISKKVKGVGAEKGAILLEKGNIVTNTDELLSQWDEILLDRMGISGFKNGKPIVSSGRAIRDPASVSLVRNIDDIIANIGDDVTLQHLDDAKSAIRSLVDRESASQLKQLNTIGEGVGKNIRKEIDNVLIDNLGDEYRQINKQFARLKGLQSNMNRRLGNIVDGGDQTRLASGLLKSSLQSNADRGTKAMFKSVLDETGIDLIKDAKFAEIAMRSVDDPRILNLLEEVSGKPRSKIGVLDQLAGKTIDKLRKSESDVLRDFFLKQQGLSKNVKPDKPLTNRLFPLTAGTRSLRDKRERDQK